MTRSPIPLFLLMLVCWWSLANADEFSELRAAAKSGDAVAQYNLGSFYGNKGRKGKGKVRDDESAVLWYTKAAQQGLAEAQFDLGRMYVIGQGITRDIELGVSWQLKAAEQGLATAQFAVGTRYYLGSGLAKDHQQAFALYLKAAEQGLVGAQNQLGGMHFRGEGVPEDNVQAHKWFNIAATNNDKIAERYILFLEEIMDSEQIEEAEELAKEWLAEHSPD